MKYDRQMGNSILQKFFEESTDYIVFIEVTKDNKPSSIHLNPAARKTLGISKQKNLLTLSLQDIYPPWSLEIITTKAFPRIIEKGVWRGKVALKNKEGKEIPISQKITAHKDAHGNIQFFSSVARNIAEFRQKEQKSKLYETALSEYISDAVIITDENFIIKTWNKGAEELYGWDKQEVINKSASAVIPSKHLTGSGEEALRQLKRKGNWRGEVTQKNKQGKTVSISTALSVVKDNQGNIREYIAVNRDISTIKEEEKNKDDFINTASHELRTPLTSFKIYLQILREKIVAKGDTDMLTFTDKMNRQVNKFAALVEELLDITKIGKEGFILHKRDFLIDELLKEIIEDVQPTIQCPLIIKQNEHITIHADKGRVQQVITNLVANAVKFSLQNKQIILTAHKKGSYLEVSVQDFGMGVAKEHHKRIFDRFYRIKEHTTYPGLGLGLYISSQIIKAHKGKMWVESKPGKGSSFYFTLPV